MCIFQVAQRQEALEMVYKSVPGVLELYLGQAGIC